MQTCEQFTMKICQEYNLLWRKCIETGKNVCQHLWRMEVTYRWVKERSRQAETLKRWKRESSGIITVLLPPALGHGLLTALYILMPSHLKTNSKYRHNVESQGKEKIKTQLDWSWVCLPVFTFVNYFSVSLQDKDEMKSKVQVGESQESYCKGRKNSVRSCFWVQDNCNSTV